MSRGREPKADEYQRDEKRQNCRFELNKWIHGFSFLFPRQIDSAIRGSGRGEEPPRGNVLHLIQTCLGTTSLKKIRRVGQTISLRARIGSFSFRNSFSLVSNALKLLTQRRCGEMADATDLKSVGLKRPVPVRVRPSAVFLNCPPMRVNFLRIADCGLTIDTNP